MTNSLRSFVDSIQNQNFFDPEKGDIVELTYLRRFYDGDGNERRGMYAHVRAFHQWKPFVREDGTKDSHDVYWVLPDDMVFLSNGELFVPVGTRECCSGGMRDVFSPYGGQKYVDCLTRLWEEDIEEQQIDVDCLIEIEGRCYGQRRTCIEEYTYEEYPYYIAWSADVAEHGSIDGEVVEDFRACTQGQGYAEVINVSRITNLVADFFRIVGKDNKPSHTENVPKLFVYSCSWDKRYEKH